MSKSSVKTIDLRPGDTQGTTFPGWTGDEPSAAQLTSPIAGTLSAWRVTVEGMAAVDWVPFGIEDHVAAGGTLTLPTPAADYAEWRFTPDAPIAESIVLEVELRGCEGVGT